MRVVGYFPSPSRSLAGRRNEEQIQRSNPTYDAFQIRDVDELIRLAPKLVGRHGPLRCPRRDNTDALALLLERRDQCAQIPVAGENHDVIEMGADKSDRRCSYPIVSRQARLFMTVPLTLLERYRDSRRRDSLRGLLTIMKPLYSSPPSSQTSKLPSGFARVILLALVDCKQIATCAKNENVTLLVPKEQKQPLEKGTHGRNRADLIMDVQAVHRR